MRSNFPRASYMVGHIVNTKYTLLWITLYLIFHVQFHTWGNCHRGVTAQPPHRMERSGGRWSQPDIWMVNASHRSCFFLNDSGYQAPCDLEALSGMPDGAPVITVILASGWRVCFIYRLSFESEHHSSLSVYPRNWETQTGYASLLPPSTVLRLQTPGFSPLPDPLRLQGIWLDLIDQ